MKKAFVVGFFDPVKKSLNENFTFQIESGALVWIGQVAPGRHPDLGLLRQRLFDALNLCPTDIYIVAGYLRGFEWVAQSLEEILSQARLCSPETLIHLSWRENLADTEGLCAWLAACKLDGPSPFRVDLLQARLRGQKALCVSIAGGPTFEAVFVRAGLPTESFAEHFVEEAVAPGKNSNLMQYLEQQGNRYLHLLYAWRGLRTSTGTVVRKFKSQGVFFEADSVSKVVALFKRSLERT